MAGVTLKLTPLVLTPLACTTTLPVIAPDGTGATILVVPQLVGVAVVTLNVTVLDPCVVPKFAPAIVTDVPTGPEFGDKLLMLGVGRTVKATPVLARLDTVTTTFPVEAPVGKGVEMLL